MMTNNYLELKKEPVRYWSKISALALTLTPVFIKPTPWTKSDWKQLSLKEKASIIGFLILLGIISYYLNYYTFSSLFWPEPLSLTNHLFLIPH